MAKLRSDPIVQEDLEQYLQEESDFAFELSVLKMLINEDLECVHGGYYIDPIGQKPREFDIRALFKSGRCYVRMAIECKNIRNNFPILVSCVPRKPHEAWHSISVSCPSGEYLPNSFDLFPGYDRDAPVQVLRSQPHESIYSDSAPVGKSVVQVGRDHNNGITANDAGLFEKWGQCLASLNDLIQDIPTDAEACEHAVLGAAMPIVVVPNDRLWVALYDKDGNIDAQPKLSDRVQVYVDREYPLTSDLGLPSFGVSHIEFMTVRGLQKFVETSLKGHGSMKAYFNF